MRHAIHWFWWRWHEYIDKMKSEKKIDEYYIHFALRCMSINTSFYESRGNSACV